MFPGQCPALRFAIKRKTLSAGAPGSTLTELGDFVGVVLRARWRCWPGCA
jgi:hypothetical protein